MGPSPTPLMSASTCAASVSSRSLGRCSGGGRGSRISGGGGGGGGGGGRSSRGGSELLKRRALAGGPSSGRSMVTALTPFREPRSSFRSQPGGRCLLHLKRSRGAEHDQLRSQPRSGAPSHSDCPTPRAEHRSRPFPDVKGAFCLAIGCRPPPRRSLSLDLCPLSRNRLANTPPHHFPIGSPPARQSSAASPLPHPRPEKDCGAIGCEESCGEEAPFPHPFNVLSNGKSTSGSEDQTKQNKKQTQALSMTYSN